MEPPLRWACNGRPERELRLPFDGALRSERQGHAVQAAGCVWQPLCIHELADTRGAFERSVGGGARLMWGSRPSMPRSTGDGLSARG